MADASWVRENGVVPRSFLDRAWLWGSPFFAAAVSALSYVGISDPTTNDFERLGNLGLLFVFCGVFALWLGWYARLWRAPERFTTSPRSFWGAWLASCILLLASFPVGSRDVFAYAFYGKMWAVYGVEPALTPPTAMRGDPWFPLLQAWWKEGAAGYGPLFLLQTRLIGWLSGDSWPVAVGLFKASNAALLALSLALLSRLCACTGKSLHAGAGPTPSSSGSAVTLWAFNPLVLFESLSSAHNDLAMAVLLLAALLLWHQRRWGWAGGLWALSVWFKWYSLVLLPVWMWWWWRRCGGLDFARSLGRSIATVGVVSALLLLPFGAGAWEVLRKPLGIDVGMRLMPTELPPTLWLLFYLLLGSGLFSVEAGKTAFHLTRYSLLFSVITWLIWRRRGAEYSLDACALDLSWSLICFFSFAVTVLWPWHLLAALALALASGTTAGWITAFVLCATGLLTYFLTFPLAAVAVSLVALVWWNGERRRSQLVSWS